MDARLIESPGLYALSAEEYLADPVKPSPSLSASLAHVLLSQSPLHCWTASQRLNPAWKPEESDAFDLGRAAHAYLLQGESLFVLIPWPDYRTKEARGARDLARAEGKVPLLMHRWTDVQAMATALRAQLAAQEPPIPFTNGQPEQTLVWEEDGVWCRARLDWLYDDRRTVDDLKTTQGSAHPAGFSRRLFDQGYDVQAAFYLRGVKAIFDMEADFRFVVTESTPPYGCAVVALDPEAMAFADQKVSRAVDLWRECLTANRWPAYPTRVCYAEVPGWEATRWAERTYYEEATRT